MVERDPVIKEKLKHTGLGDFKGAYKFAREWLAKEDYEVTEESYSEKVSGNSKDLDIEWVATRKLTDYYKVVFKLKWKLIALTDVEVEIDGKRKGMNKFAELSIEMRGVLEKDYDSKWEHSAFEKFFKDVYNKYVVIERTKEKEKWIRESIQEFKEEMKAFLELTGRTS